MPPFKLELPDRRATHNRTVQIIYTKNAYSEGVKMHDWQRLLEHKPIENDPYCAGNMNYFLSHYKRFGHHVNSFKTCTREAMEQIYDKKKLPREKHLANYCTFDENAECSTDCNLCDHVASNDYVTTMQHSYQMPKPYAMQRLAFPKIPFMRNRRFRNEDPRSSTCKFFDDNFSYGACHLYKYNGQHYDSYNFMTGKYRSEELKTKS